MVLPKSAPDPALDLLRTKWIDLYAHRLPSLAASRSPVQSRWPVHLDHCFARILLDNAIGIDVPWTAKIKAPAVKNMTSAQLEICIKLGEGIAEGREDLVVLDRRSLEIRGKNGKGGKRALERGNEELPRKTAKRKKETCVEAQKSSAEELVVKATELKSSKNRQRQTDIRALMSGIKSPNPDHGVSSSLAQRSAPDSAKSEKDNVQTTEIDEDITQLIATSADLTPYRKKVLLLLTQVPPSRYTTYAAMSTFLKSSPRAVGNAMRNNPFAPAVPCHRVLAANGGIGGFGGDWGAEGRHAKEKIRLLREEGVRFDGKGKVVGRPFTEFA